MKTKIALFRPDEELYRDVEKLDPKEHCLVGKFDDTDELLECYCDYILIPFQGFRKCRQLLNKVLGSSGKVLTFKEYWVLGSEQKTKEIYYNKWSADSRFFEQKNVVIVGGGSGVGRETARAFLKMGANVVICGRNYDKLDTAVCELGGKRIHLLQWDISDVSAAKNKITEAERIFSGSISILVNSAGIIAKKAFLDITESDYDNIMQTNLKGSYFLCQAMMRYFLKKHIRGHIVNVGSVTGTLPVLNPYGVSKWGIAGLTKGLGMNYAEYGVVVNGVAPTEIATDMQEWKEGDVPARRAQVTGRILYPWEVADMITFLAGPQGETMPGEMLNCRSGDFSWGGIR